MGSYNYLGFAENDGLCSRNAAAIIDDLGLSVCTAVQEQGFFILLEMFRNCCCCFSVIIQNFKTLL